MFQLQQDLFQVRVEKGKSKYFPQIVYSNGFNCMPPAFLVDRYKINNISQKLIKQEIKGYIIDSVITYGNLLIDTNWKLYDKVRLGWKQNEPEYYEKYMAWPRRFSFTCKSARENDRRLKIKKWPAYHDELVRIYGYDWKTPSLNFAREWVSVAKSNLKYDDWTKQYVNAHQESHPVRKVSWGQLLKWEKMPILFNFTKDFVDWWDSHFDDPGDWSLSQTTINYGIRARSPTVDFKAYQDFELDRARQIGFNPGPSTVNAFCRHEYQVKQMRKVLDYYEDKWGSKIISPKTEGGKAYLILQEEFLNGEVLMNYDVAGMELITPTVIAGSVKTLPPGIGCCVSYLQDIPEFLSGVGNTGDWTVIAHLDYLDKLIIVPPKVVCILGDDGTHVGGKIKSSILYEPQPRDQEIHRTLGLTTTKYMHPVGRNITIDNAKQSIQVVQDQWVKNKLTFEQRDSIADLFLGNVNGVPLQELIGKVSSQPFAYSPKELLQQGLQIPIGI